ncbi:E3 ubiquitin-protein ligase SIAH1B-like isoform X2 [Periplaneta americana]
MGRSLREALECPVCFESMVPPITMCTSGHSLCRACRPRLPSCPTCRQPLLGIRNVALESLARELLPQDVLQAPQEQLTTPMEPNYGCPLDCPWTGLKSEIRLHVSMDHSDKILVGIREHSCQWELPLIVKDVRVIFAFGEVFRYRLRLHTIKKIFYITVQYVGLPSDATKFKYEAELNTGEGQQKVMVVGHPTLGHQQDLQAVYDSGGCITLDYDLVKNVALGKQLVFIVKLTKCAS